MDNNLHVHEGIIYVLKCCWDNGKVFPIFSLIDINYNTHSQWRDKCQKFERNEIDHRKKTVKTAFPPEASISPGPAPDSKPDLPSISSQCWLLLVSFLLPLVCWGIAHPSLGEPLSRPFAIKPPSHIKQLIKLGVMSPEVGDGGLFDPNDSIHESACWML